MIEPEMAFYDLVDNMDLAEQFLKRIFRDVLEQCREDMDFFNLRVDKTVIETAENIVSSQFVRLTYTEAVEILQKSGTSFEYPRHLGRRPAIGARAVSHRGEVRLWGHPVTTTRGRSNRFTCASTTTTKRSGPWTCWSPKVGEIIGGSQREERLDVVLQRMKEQDLNADDYWWYLVSAPLRHGSPTPVSGWGLERLVPVCHRHDQHPRRNPLPPARRATRSFNNCVKSTPKPRDCNPGACGLPRRNGFFFS